jgi:hypothetical protein
VCAGTAIATMHDAVDDHVDRSRIVFREKTCKEINGAVGRHAVMKAGTREEFRCAVPI